MIHLTVTFGYPQGEKVEGIGQENGLMGQIKHDGVLPCHLLVVTLGKSLNLFVLVS